MSEESNLSDVTSQESNNTNYDTDDTVRTSSTRPIETTKKPAVLTDDESILKFTQGEPIVDQRNPFKKNNNNNNKNYDKKSISPTKIPQLKREQFKNAINALKKSTSDDLITTEEVLRQSKYVKTYIKNPDPYFVYDPAILERIREEELKRKEEIKAANKENIKALKKKLATERQTKEVKAVPKSKIPYKKCSKPNYPDLADIKVKVGTDVDGTYFNPTEVKTNVKKFDECVKKKRFNFDEDSEDMEEHLPKSSSNEDLTTNYQNETNSQNQTNGNNDGSFTNTINSKDFQQYLVKKGLVLAPQQPVNEAKTTRIYPAPPKPNRTIHNHKAPEQRQVSYNQRPPSTQPDTDSEGTPKKIKKSSLLQRLLANNIFSARRKTTPKEPVPKPRCSYDAGGSNVHLKENQRQLPLTKRIVLERKNEPHEPRTLAFNYISNPMLESDNANNPTLRLQPKNENMQKFQENSNCEPYAKHHMMNGRNSAPNREIVKSPQRTNLPLQPSQVQRRPFYGNQQAPTFARTVSMDRNEILRRSKAAAPFRTLQNFNPNPNRCKTQSISSDIAFEPHHGPKTTSTPIRPKSSTESQPQRFASSSTIASSLYDDAAHSNPNISKSDWLRLREQQQLQQSTDRELYTNVLNRTPQNNENLYERLPIRHIQADQAAMHPIYSSLDKRCYFVRGGQQRNTFCGSSRDPNYKNYNNIVPAAEQAQSENNFQLSHVNMLERNQPSRLSTNTLSREEIIEKVKQFCRNSMRKKAEKQAEQKSESGTEVPLAETEVSPASYATVGSQQLRPAGRKPAPQVPQRMQSLKRNPEPAINCTTPVYSNLCKDNSMPLQQQSRASSNLQSLGIENIPYATIERRGRKGLATAPQYVSNTLIESAEQSAPRSSFENGRNLMRHLAKPPRQLQQIVLAERNFGRNTPLILERSQNLQSQIYRPRYRDAVKQHNLDDRLLVQTNSHSGQHFSGSLNFQPIECVDQLDGERIARHQIPMPLPQFEPYMPEIAENKRRINYEGSLHSKEDWQNENNKPGRQPTNEQAVNDERRRSSRREDPRRHTLGGDMLQYGVMQGQPQQRSMDLENQPVRSYAPVNQGPLFDDDPGIMSEVETASTGFRRGGKQRSSLPVVRTPSKTLERPLGLVFLQYRSETKRALLPNEITSIDTVRALFVRSFPRQLTMAYLEGPNVKIYIHDASKDMFYELEDVRSHLREIRDRSVLRLFESNEVAAPPQVLPGGPGIPQPLPQAVPMQWDQDQSYFSEPEFDSEYQHQHIHKSKPGKQPPYYVGASQTLPRGMYSDRNKVAIGAPAKPLRSYGSRGNMGPIFPYPPDQLYSIPDGYTSSPERGTRGSYEEPYYSQYGTRGNVVAPIIDEENSEVAMTEDQYALYGMKMGPGRIPRTANQMYDPTRPEDLHRIRVEHMERQLANLTGLVQKALVNQNPQIAPSPVPTLNPNYLGVPAQCRDAIEELYGLSGGSHITIQANGTGEEIYVREKAPKLGKSSCHKSVSFEKSVSFSDDIQGVPKSHSPQHAADTKPTKPAIKSSTLPRTSSQERDRLKPPPPPKPISLTQTHSSYRADIALAPEVYNHLRGLQKKAKDLRMEVRTLRRLSQAQAVAVREDIKDAFMRIRATLLASSGNYWDQQGDQEKTRISREEELYKQEIIRLEKDLSDLESSVEGLRGEVINRRTRVNMAAVEDMALVLSRASKTVAELKLRFPGLSNGIRNLISNEMEKVVREEKFLKEEPDRLESALRRCKKLTGTLVTLKRLASVQEQRLPPNEPTANEEPPCSAEISTASKQPVPTPRMGPIAISGGIPPENALDALLDELQTFAKPLNQHNDFRPEDSTSDDSSQAILSTVTTQIPQACLYNPNDPNAAQQPNELQESQIGTISAAPLNHSMSNVNMLQVNANLGSLRRLHSYPSGSDTDTSPPQPARMPGKPPVPERNAELLSKVGNKRIPPPPPPRTSSRSPLASPTSPNVPHRMPSLSETETLIGNGAVEDGSGNSSGNESGNDQMQRQVALERRHQELLRKQKMLQEQYQRLQQMSKMPAVATMPPPPTDIMQLKKTGSESNLPHKMDLSVASATGSMKNLNAEANTCVPGLVNDKNEKNIALVKQQMMDGASKTNSPKLTRNESVANNEAEPNAPNNNTSCTTIKQVYETEIL